MRSKQTQTECTLLHAIFIEQLEHIATAVCQLVHIYTDEMYSSSMVHLILTTT